MVVVVVVVVVVVGLCLCTNNFPANRNCQLSPAKKVEKYILYFCFRKCLASVARGAAAASDGLTEVDPENPENPDHPQDPESQPEGPEAEEGDTTADVPPQPLPALEDRRTDVASTPQDGNPATAQPQVIIVTQDRSGGIQVTTPSASGPNFASVASVTPEGYPMGFSPIGSPTGSPIGSPTGSPPGSPPGPSPPCPPPAAGQPRRGTLATVVEAASAGFWRSFGNRVMPMGGPQ